MNIEGKHYRTIWENPENDSVINIIDQRLLPHKFEIVGLKTLDDAVKAIAEMYVRGAPLIGAAAAYGMYLAAVNADKENFENKIQEAADKLKAARPTAVNLAWAVDEQLKVISDAADIDSKINAAREKARNICDEDALFCKSIGEKGIWLIDRIACQKEGPVNILTHCNAGWLATVDYGTATAPIYTAYDMGIEVHVWVDETRPRSQGAKLTSWELTRHGVPNTLIVDNAGGHLMQKGLVDMVIVGSDRTTHTGDVANKIGTYLKALAAYDNEVPFYVAVPSTSIDWNIDDGVNDIPIEERNNVEVLYVDGLVDGEIKKALVPAKGTKAANYSFDVTPRHLVTALITERGICKADKGSIYELFPEKA